MKHICFLSGIGLLLLCLFLSPVSAFDIREGDTLVISEPVSDDLLVSGSSVTINAPVKSVTFVGGELVVNAPVEENLIAAGGRIEVNAPVGMDVIAAGGEVLVHSEIQGKLLTAAGTVTMDGTATNAGISAGTAIFSEKSHILRDAYINAGGYEADGLVDGTLVAEGEPGVSEESFDLSGLAGVIGMIVLVVQIIFFIGMLILGVVLVLLIPSPVRQIADTIREKTLLSFALGLGGIIAGGILCLLLACTLIGIPLSVFIALMLMAGLILSPLMGGVALGLFITEKLHAGSSLLFSGVIGFIILAVLFCIPLIGIVVKMVAVCIGFGGILLAAGEHSRGVQNS